MYEETAEKILRIADSLMVRRGYSAFSDAGISKAIGIRKASIHHHFPTKDGLAVAVLGAHLEKVVQGMEILRFSVRKLLCTFKPTSSTGRDGFAVKRRPFA
jgi:TetR/AcrR family transcriptional regulator, transcriptional repressor for nem operon